MAPNPDSARINALPGTGPGTRRPSQMRRRLSARRKSRLSEASAAAAAAAEEMQLMRPDSESELAEEEVNVDTELDESFFEQSHKIIEQLMLDKKQVEAYTLKKHLAIIMRLKARLKEEAEENDRLRPEVQRAHDKLRYALQLILGSEKQLNVLRDSLTKAWMNADASMLREQTTIDHLKTMQERCEIYQTNEEKHMEDSQDFGLLSKYKNMIMRERDRLSNEVRELEKRLQLHRIYTDAVDTKNDICQSQLEKYMAKDRRWQRINLSNSLKLSQLQALFDDQRHQYGRLQVKHSELHADFTNLNTALQEKHAEADKQRIIIERFNKENLTQLMTIDKLEDFLHGKDKSIRMFEMTIKELKEEQKRKDEHFQHMNFQNQRLKRQQIANAIKINKLHRLRDSQVHDINNLKNRIDSLRRRLQTAGQQHDELRREYEIITQDRDLLRNIQYKQNAHINGLRQLNATQLNDIDSLRGDVKRMCAKLDEAKITQVRLEKDRNELQQEVDTLNRRVQDMEAEIIKRQDMIETLNLEVRKERDLIHNLQRQIEAAHSEKMAMKRELNNTTQERDDHSRNVARLLHQNNQFSAQIEELFEKIKNLKATIEQLRNHQKILENQIGLRDRQLTSVRQELKTAKLKNETLAHTISEDERRFVKMSLTLDDMLKQKNLVGHQMARRNDEIIILRDRLNNNEFTLTRTQTKYNQHMNDIRILKTEIVNLQTERDCLKRALKATPNLRQEIIRLHRLLNQERIKVRGFIDDLKTPCGIHRWRILKGADPSKFFLIEKVQRLQRRNLRIEVEKTNLQQKLQEAEAVTNSLKHLLENLPMGELRAKLVATQRINREQTQRLKSLSAELAIDQIEMAERDAVISNFKARFVETERKRLSLEFHGIHHEGGGPTMVEKGKILHRKVASPQSSEKGFLTSNNSAVSDAENHHETSVASK